MIHQCPKSVFSVHRLSQDGCIPVSKTLNLKWLTWICYFIVLEGFIFPRMQCQTAIYFRQETVLYPKESNIPNPSVQAEWNTRSIFQ